jgi:hypothetical protein
MEPALIFPKQFDSYESGIFLFKQYLLWSSFNKIRMYFECKTI